MGKYKVIKFGKEGCAPCENVDAFLVSNDIEYEKIDILSEDDEVLELCAKYGVGMSIPKTFLVDVETDEVIEAKNGFNPAALNLVINKYKEGL